MTDKEKEQETRDHIFGAARRIFRHKGYAGARMQEIAEEAGINKSMIYYYFRSKDNLFYKVLQKEINLFFPHILRILNSNDHLDIKIEHLIDNYYGILQDYPDIARFIFGEMDRHSNHVQNLIDTIGDLPPKSVSKEIHEQIKLGNMVSVKPEQLILSIFALVLFPFIAQPLVESLFNLDQSGYRKFLENRKNYLSAFILNGIKYQRL